ncbi:hypothetical protein B0T16DRAFT_453443 [Cercophora newfieldiana]|uniref:Uncharacterized protein n=1 Tax=Cercophora newfieldiana TaxID=92897 RepID=A0AA39YSX0_9PEZI|nr:hypothetical protein B0T16DRAFT_453443 [Cercophora newfieldiana]
MEGVSQEKVAMSEPLTIKRDPPARNASQKLEGWPPPPASLKKPTLDTVLGILVDAASVASFFLFMALAVAAARVHGRLVNFQEWDMLYAALNAAVTIFPLVYMFISARTIKFLASRALERGTTLGSLEQLLASRSLGGAVSILWSLQTINLVGLLLITVTAISPLGAQAALQMLKTEDRAELSQPGITYLTSLAGSSSILELSPGYLTENLPGLNSLYTSSISASPQIKNSSVDLWGNVKIPWLPRPNTATPDSEGWYDVPPELAAEKYSSLVGVPIVNLPSGKNTSFSIETSYMDLDCYDLFLGDPVNITHPNIAVPANQSAPAPYRGSIPTTQSRFRIALDSIRPGYTDPEIWRYLNDTSTTYPQRTLLLQSPTSGVESLDKVNTAHCRISTVYIEALTICLSPRSGLLLPPSCSVTRLRPSRRPHPHPNLTPFEFGQYLASFGENFPEATTFASRWIASSPASSLAEMYLVNPMNPLSPTPDDPLTFRQPLRLHALVSPAQLSERLGQLVNTYHLGSLSPGAITGITIKNAASLSEAELGAGYTTARDGVVVEMNETRYVCRWGWWGLFVVACVVMLGAAVTGIVVRTGLVGPDILGYVSSLTRDSPYVRIAEGGSAVDGAERARLLSGLRVQLRDVGSKGREVGKLVFASMEGAEEEVVGRPVICNFVVHTK